MKSNIHVGRLDIDGEAIAKLNGKHFITEDEVRGLIQWPARVPAVFDDDPEHGPRWITLVHTSAGLRFFAALEPLPEWEQENADTWHLRTAYWLD